ncbi:MAG: response regulator [Desulfococcaceae bacterium]
MKEKAVLIVDDESAQCDNLADILTDEGYITYSAGTCAEALALARKKKPAAAILDLKLPDGHGTRLLADLKTMLPDILCIMATAYADTDSAIHAVRHGAFHYLSKPLRPDELLQILERAFDLVRLREEKEASENGRKLLLAELKMRNMELESAKNYVKNIIDSLSSVLLSVDREGRIIEWNIQAEKEAGITWENVRGRHASDFFPCISKQLDSLNNVMEKGQPFRWEKLAVEVNGEKQYKDVGIFPLTGEGQQGAVIQIDNITIRVRIEEMMVQAEKMMSVGGLAAGMAHEINNPLGGILQSVQNILRRTSPELPKNEEIAGECGTNLQTIRCYLEKRNILNFLESIRESGNRASEIIHKVIRFSRPGESRMAPLNPAERAERALELAAHDYDLRKKYDFRNIEIIREIDPEMPKVPCMETEMEQVLLSLLRNAAQALDSRFPASGEKEISDRKPRIILRVLKEGKMARIEVEDNGPGMEPHIVKRIFEPFFTTKQVGTGPGLGLSVSYYIITNNHKGTLTVESEPGKGTRCIIRLPLLRSAS